MRHALLHSVLLGLLAFSFAPTPSPAAPIAGPFARPGVAPTVNLCRPDLDCMRGCAQRASRVRLACFEAGHPRRECRKRSREVYRACIESDCRPIYDCKDRCESHGNRLLRRCVENGGDLKRCRTDSGKAIEACIERNCRDCVCPDVYDPVCGVDSMSYGNACEAHCAGVKIRHEGICEPVCLPLPCDVFCEFGNKIGPDGCPTCECNPPPGCRSDADCDDDQICREICPLRPCFEADPNCGTCVGVCLPRPDPCLCPRVWNPVCGADGETYGNTCEAGCAGVDIVGRGECLTNRCLDRAFCNIYCPTGFQVGVDGCPICRCNPISNGEPISGGVFGSPP